jgi:hypothetical protein
MDPTLAGSALFAILATFLYARVGLQQVQRETSPETRRAVQMFGVWWLTLGAATLMGALSSLAASAGYRNVDVFEGLLYVELLLICIGLMGLLYYLLYLFTGRRGLLGPLVVVYAVFFVALLVEFYQANPIAVTVGRWAATVTYERPLTASATVLFTAALILPQILGAFAYLTVAFRVKDRTPRFRIVLVSTSIIVWFLSSLLASVGGLNEADWWQAASRSLGLLAALATYVAYNPPRYLTERYGIEPLRKGQAETVATQVRERAHRVAVGLVLLARAACGAVVPAAPRMNS